MLSTSVANLNILINLAKIVNSDITVLYRLLASQTDISISKVQDYINQLHYMVHSTQASRVCHIHMDVVLEFITYLPEIRTNYFPYNYHHNMIVMKFKGWLPVTIRLRRAPSPVLKVLKATIKKVKVFKVFSL